MSRLVLSASIRTSQAIASESTRPLRRLEVAISAITCTLDAETRLGCRPTLPVPSAAVGSTGFSTALALTAGVMGAVQIAILGVLGQRIGELEASAFAFVVTAVAGIAILLVTRQSLSGLVEATRQPWWMVAGGLTGVFIVGSVVVAGPRIGIVATTTLLIAGQLTAATLIDRYGLFGSARIPVDATRAIGIALLAAGAILTVRR